MRALTAACGAAPGITFLLAPGAATNVIRPELLWDEDSSPELLCDFLLLVGEYVPVETIASWAPMERAIVGDWAARTHMDASDNRVKLRRRPAGLLGTENG